MTIAASHTLKSDFARQTLGRSGDLEVCLTGDPQDIKRAQKLRYHVFYEELSAVADLTTLRTQRDEDAFDECCDHLLVLDHSALGKAQVVGTYRLLRQSIAQANTGFYTQNEFDIAKLIERHDTLNFLELGRSCVLKEYRTKNTVELLWHGIWAYVLEHRLDVMLGCASFEGTDSAELSLPLSYLHHFHQPPTEWSVSAHAQRCAEFKLLPKEGINPRQALRSLPPLIKGYLRLGAYIGEGAVIDPQFNTTDVLIILPVSAISPKYVNYYGADADRYR